MSQRGRYIVFFVDDLTKNEVYDFLPPPGDRGYEWSFFRASHGPAALAIGVVTNSLFIVIKLQEGTNWVASVTDRSTRNKTRRSSRKSRN